MHRKYLGNNLSRQIIHLNEEYVNGDASHVDYRIFIECKRIESCAIDRHNRRERVRHNLLENLTGG